MKDDAARIQKWAAIFKNPTELAKTIFTNTLKNAGALKADIG